jgi:hypothetical protein
MQVIYCLVTELQLCKFIIRISYDSQNKHISCTSLKNTGKQLLILKKVQSVLFEMESEL